MGPTGSPTYQNPPEEFGFFGPLDGFEEEEKTPEIAPHPPSSSLPPDFSESETPIKTDIIEEEEVEAHLVNTLEQAKKTFQAEAELIQSNIAYKTFTSISQLFGNEERLDLKNSSFEVKKIKALFKTIKPGSYFIGSSRVKKGFSQSYIVEDPSIGAYFSVILTDNEEVRNYDSIKKIWETLKSNLPQKPDIDKTFKAIKLTLNELHQKTQFPGKQVSVNLTLKIRSTLWTATQGDCESLIINKALDCIKLSQCSTDYLGEPEAVPCRITRIPELETPTFLIQTSGLSKLATSTQVAALALQRAHKKDPLGTVASYILSAALNTHKKLGTESPVPVKDLKKLNILVTYLNR